MKFLLIILFIFSPYAFCDNQELCDYFGWDCDSSGSSSLKGKGSGQSYNSASAATTFNPANVKILKGYGVEAIYQPNNAVLFNLAGGNGTAGGAVISNTLEGGFFGNRPAEIKEYIQDRTKHQHQYKSKKINVTLGKEIYNKKLLNITLGLTFKRNPIVKVINPGIGISGRFGFLNFGYAVYKDDVAMELLNYNDPYQNNTAYSTIHNANTYSERFKVETYSLGTKIGKWAFDMGSIRTRYVFYPEHSVAKIYSVSYKIKKWQFNYGIRKEYSPQYRYFNDTMIEQRKKTSSFMAVQKTFKSRYILGLQHNYFLLNELSLLGTIYF